MGFEALWTPLKYRDARGDLHMIDDGRIKSWEELGEFDFFERGRGYWIHATQECVWEVPL